MAMRPMADTPTDTWRGECTNLWRVIVSNSVLLCVAVWCSVLLSAAVCCCLLLCANGDEAYGGYSDRHMAG